MQVEFIYFGALIIILDAKEARPQVVSCQIIDQIRGHVELLESSSQIQPRGDLITYYLCPVDLHILNTYCLY